MKRDRKILIISGITIIYMIAAFSWWAVLLHRKNHEIYVTKKENINFKSPDVLSLELNSIRETYQSQTKMIWGESIVFMLSLILSCWLLYRALNKEIEISNNQNNFLLSVTHELKSPIASLLLSIDTIKQRNLDKVTQIKLLNNARADTKRLESLVQNILFSTKLEASYQFNFEKLDLAKLVAYIVNKTNQQYVNEIIKFAWKEDIDYHLMADKEAMISVIDNLVNNAIKYTVDQKPNIEIKIEVTEKHMTLQCIDEGIGINEDEKAKIFDKFYRIGDEDTRKSTGTGLGLHIVKQIMVAHNGSINVTNNNPKGCIFSVKLPLIQVKS